MIAAGYQYRKIKDIYVSSHLAPEIAQKMSAALDEARMMDPFEGYYSFLSGDLAVVRQNRDVARAYFLDAARKKPMSGIYLQRVAMMMPGDRIQDAAALMEEGYRRAVNKERLILSWVEWLLVVGQREDAKSKLHWLLMRTPDRIVTFSPILETHRFNQKEMLEIMPRRVEPWLAYGAYQERLGNIESAAFYREQALEFIDNEAEIKPAWIKQLVDFYQRHNQPDKALETMRRGVALIPDYAPFHAWLGDYYRRVGITYRAKEEYEQAVLLDPGNESYQKRLRKLELDIEFGE